jgi:hypothetical protein
LLLCLTFAWKEWLEDEERQEKGKHLEKKSLTHHTLACIGMGDDGKKAKVMDV